MSLALILALGMLQTGEFLAPESADIGLPPTSVICGERGVAGYYITVEFQNGRNRFDLFRSAGDKQQRTHDQIGGVLVTDVGGGWDWRLRPKAAANLELKLILRPDQPVAATLSFDTSNNETPCVVVHSPSEVDK